MLDSPRDKICSCHGTLGSFKCEGCSTPMSTSEFVTLLKFNIKDIYKTEETDYNAPEKSTPIICPRCNKGLVKPATVLYGRNLPQEFYDKSIVDMPENVNVLLVLGTSLTVHPAAGIPDMMNLKVSENEDEIEKLRVVINLEETVGSTSIDFDANASDIALQGGCDEICLDLIELCGWMDDFIIYKELMCESSQQKIDERINLKVCKNEDDENDRDSKRCKTINDL